MAEIIGSSKGTPGKRKVTSIKVDLTPMVDLGFLLITFFVFTTSIANPTSMKLSMPDDSNTGNPSTTSDRKTMTLILASEKDIFFYQGMFNNNLSRTTYHSSGIRSVLTTMQKQVRSTFGNHAATTIIIKPTHQAFFKNVVDVLDELLINNVSRYVIVEPAEIELHAIKRFSSAL